MRRAASGSTVAIDNAARRSGSMNASGRLVDDCGAVAPIASSSGSASCKRTRFGTARTPAWLVLATLVALALTTPSAHAHHSTAALYDRNRIIETEGVITKVAWANPHVRLELRDAADGGRVWQIESNSVSIVSRFGLTADLLTVGSRVKIAGNPGRVDRDLLFLTNLLLPTGAEVLFGAGIPARWSQRTIGTDVRGAVAADPSRGLFRVWTNTVAPPQFWGDSYPLTPAAAAAQAKFDPIGDDPTKGCRPKGMPYVMEQPYPIELVDAGDTILLKLEEYDTVRTIAMHGEAAASTQRPARLGTSVGRWDGAALVVTTTDIDYPFVNNTGIPLGRGASIVERFTPTLDGSRLEYSMTIDDPATFTAPVTLRKAWEWRPGEQLRPYDCRR
jgi:hypothetical protein